MLAYVRRKVATGRGKPVANDDEPEQPLGHGFSQPGLWRRHLAGEVLVVWLFGCLRFGRTALPPALDARMLLGAEDAFDTPGVATMARLKAAGLGPDDGRFRHALLADPDPAVSYFLPWVDATDLMFELGFEPHGARLPAALRARPSLLPRHFQTSRILTADAVKCIEAHAAEVRARPRVFVSYRWATGTRQAAGAVQALSQRGFASWWDRWGMSRSVAEGRAEIGRGTVETALTRACNGCSHALLVPSPGYGKSTWTRWEQDLLHEMAEDKRIELIEP